MQPNLNQSTDALSNNQIIYWDEDDQISHLSPQARRVVQVACEYADRFTDPKTGMVEGDEHPGPDTRSSLYCAIAFLLALAGIFVILSQLKINVTNAYAGSIAWSNFFSRLTHSHPGRVVCLVFNVVPYVALLIVG